jgi:hypothetical protein
MMVATKKDNKYARPWSGRGMLKETLANFFKIRIIPAMEQSDGEITQMWHESCP